MSNHTETEVGAFYDPGHAMRTMDPGHHSYCDVVALAAGTFNHRGGPKVTSERYFISCDHGRKYYVIALSNRKAWREWLEFWDGFGGPPSWAVPVNDGLSNVTFEKPEGM